MVSSRALMAGYLPEPSKHSIMAELSGCTNNAIDCRTEFFLMSSSGISTLCGCKKNTCSNYQNNTFKLDIQAGTICHIMATSQLVIPSVHDNKQNAFKLCKQ